MNPKYEATDNVDVSEDNQKSKKDTPSFIYVLTFLSTIGGFLFGYDTGVVSGAMILIRTHFVLDNAWHEAIVSVTIGAAWLFALVGGWLTDYMGRKPVILIASIVFTAGSVVMGLASSKELLLIGRIIVGVGIGIASMSVPVYIAESALPEARGPLVTVNTLCITFGQFIAAAVCGAFSTYEEGWRFMLGFAAIPAAIQFFGFLGMPESPRWLVSKNRYDEAAKVLRSIRGEDFPIDEELESMKVSFTQQQNENYGTRSLWLQVLRCPSTRRALTLGCMLQGFQQLAGINTVMYYSASIIQMAGIKDVSVVIWLACATAAVNFLCTFIGLFLVERVGRRRLTLLSLAGVVVSLIILGVGFTLSSVDGPDNFGGDDACGVSMSCSECVENVNCGFCYTAGSTEVTNGTCWSITKSDDDYPLVGPCGNGTNVDENGVTWAVGWCPSKYSWITVSALGVYLLFFAPGMGPMPWTINSEIYPMWARSFCNSVATSTNWIFNLLISMTFLTLTELLTKQGAFYLFAALAGLGLVLLYLMLPETKGKSLEDMETLFAGPWCSRVAASHSKNIQNPLEAEN